LLANIYLDRLDQAWQADYWRFGELTRYADDRAPRMLKEVPV
jgi:hypothetical protein